MSLMMFSTRLDASAAFSATSIDFMNRSRNCARPRERAG
jgi:hypothetical protein